MKNPLVTVIVPAYNIEKYIRECIESILNQTYKNLEVIIIDDGSRDATGMICDEFMYDPRVNVIHKKNEGLVAARKQGLQLSSGDYISFVDGDDRIDPRFIYELLNNLQNTKADFVHSGYTEMRKGTYSSCCGVSTGKISLDTNKEKIDFIREYVFSTHSSHWITGSIWSKLFKKEIIRKCYCQVPDSQSYGEDFLCLIHCLMNCTSISLLNAELYYYRIRVNSMSNIRENKLWEHELQLNNALLRLCAQYNLYELKISAYIFSRNKIENLSCAMTRNHWYFFKNIDLIAHKNIIIYGMGAVGKCYVEQFSADNTCNIVLLTDKNFANICCDEFTVSSVDEIDNVTYDYILIAVESAATAEEIRKELERRRDIDPQKIIWECPECYLVHPSL